MKKGFFLFLLLLVVTVSSKVYALDIVRPTSDYYVNDYAEILSSETKNYIKDNSVKLYNNTGAQIVVVTVKNIGDASMDSYSIEVARSFEIGDKKENNGILLIVSKEDREIRIEVGYGLEGVITDAKSGKILDDYVIPYFKNGDWDQGILNGYKAIYKEVGNYYGSGENIELPEVENNNTQETDEDDAIVSIFSMLLVGKIIYTIILLGIDLDTKRSKIVNFIILEVLSSIIAAGSYYVSMDIGAVYLIIFGTIANIIAVNAYLEGSGGSYGGGSYGGHYHSGGHSSGHHGGGGSFGGGGASRRF